MKVNHGGEVWHVLNICVFLIAIKLNMSLLFCIVSVYAKNHQVKQINLVSIEMCICNKIFVPAWNLFRRNLFHRKFVLSELFKWKISFWHIIACAC
jgi:hypothetical protein